MENIQINSSGFMNTDFRSTAFVPQDASLRPSRSDRPRRQTKASPRVLKHSLKNYLKALRAAEMAVWEAMDAAPTSMVPNPVDRSSAVCASSGLGSSSI
jgi:hypothetical protein